jgi:hypothetical protein
MLVHASHEYKMVLFSAKTMESIGMYDITTGIRHISVFIVPKICRTPGTVINVSSSRFIFMGLIFRL